MIDPPRLWQHQQDAIDFGLKLGGFGLFSDMGTGKSRVVIELLKRRYCHRVMIVCPPAAYASWAYNIKEYAGDWFDYRILDESKVERAENIRRVIEGSSKPLIFLTSYQSVWREPIKSVIRRSAFDCLVADEAHYIKGAGSGVSKWFGMMARYTPWRIALTGTPMAERPTDIYGIYRFLNPQAFGTNYEEFLDKYTLRVPVGKGGMRKRVVQYINTQEMHDKMFKIAFRVEASSVLDLPPEIEMVRTFRLPPAARRAYNEIEEELITQVEDGSTATANSILTVRLRCQQVTSGYIRDTDGDDHALHKLKEDALVDVLEEISGPVVVFGWFKWDLRTAEKAAARTGRKYAELSGDVNQLDGHYYPEGVDVLGVQLQSGSTAVDFSKSSVAVYLSNFSLSMYQQSKARLNRPGQKGSSVRYIHILAENSIDRIMYRSLIDKHEINQTILKKGLYDRTYV